MEYTYFFAYTYASQFVGDGVGNASYSFDNELTYKDILLVQKYINDTKFNNNATVVINNFILLKMSKKGEKKK